MTDITVKDARAALWCELDDLSGGAKAGTCVNIVDAIEAFIDAKLQEHAAAKPAEGEGAR